jgi:hypothetical protein
MLNYYIILLLKKIKYFYLNYILILKTYNLLLLKIFN